ncbi:hypothetical protein niasHS_004315 [Heterodera schachtii]|uniref:MATH domain-containing protein n=1 Tax=Heterodera schachtii TaxID=97005 RepID=A0ABD2K1K4_HETSC
MEAYNKTSRTALRWSDEQCRQKGIECSAENRRKILDPILSNIRFPLIPKEDFTKSVVPTDVLTTEEVISIYQHYSHPNLSGVPGLFPLKFPTQQRYKYEDKIEIEIEKLSEFALKKAKINTKNGSTEKWLDFYLLCDSSEKDGNWSRKSSATFRIVSQKSDVEDLKKEFNRAVFNNKVPSWGWSNFISFAELMDPSKGLYNKDEDKVNLAIDFTCD